MIKVYLVEDQALVRDAVAALLGDARQQDEVPKRLPRL